MANRVTEADVEEVYESAERLGTGTVTAHITTANTLLNDRVSGKENVTESLLTEMEKYLAAHFCILHYEKGGFTKRKIEESEDWYKEIKGDGFDSTWAGQVAIALDPSGTLASLGKKRAIFKARNILPSVTRIGTDG